jgi:hypothetical protein
VTGDARLPARLEASSLMRRAEVEGGNGIIVARGDPDRGALLLIVMQRGGHVACLERALQSTGAYAWQTVGPASGAPESEVASWSAQRRKSDPDLWLIELDVALPQRFIAETIAIG